MLDREAGEKKKEAVEEGKEQGVRSQMDYPSREEIATSSGASSVDDVDNGEKSENVAGTWFRSRSRSRSRPHVRRSILTPVVGEVKEAKEGGQEASTSSASRVGQGGAN